MAERFVELLYKIADGKEFVHIDLTSEDARELIYEVYGGEETLRTEYPYTNKAFSRAASTPAGQTSMPKMAQDYEHDPIGQFADGVALDIFGMQQDGLFRAREVSSFADQKAEIEHRIVVVDENMEILDESRKAAEYTTSMETILCTDKMQKGKAYDIFCYSIEIDAKDEKMQMELCTSYAFVAGKSICVASKTTLDFPQPSESKRDTVYICYSRHPKNVKSFDRIYPEALEDGKQKLILDVYGNVEMLPGYEYSSIYPALFTMRLTTKSGMAYYKNEVTQDNRLGNCFKKTSSGVTFTFPQDWKDYVPTEKLSVNDKAELTISFLLSAFNKSGERVDDKFSFANYFGPDASGGDICYTPPIVMVWGCVAADSQVRMGDGSIRMIKDINPGDMVCSGNGKGCRVANTWKGTESGESVEIVTKDGKRLSCTKTHPVITKRGIIPAAKLKYSDSLYGEEGALLEIDYLQPVQIGEVFNLELEGEEHTFFCNGILTGDNWMQNQQHEKEESEKLAEVIAEVERKNRLWNQQEG